MEKIKSKRGFASMSPEKRSEIARKGGMAVKPENRAFSKDRALASRSGKKGGASVKGENRTFSLDRQFASDAGKKGIAARLAKNPVQIDLEEWIKTNPKS